MFVLLAAIPYLVTFYFYWVDSADLFRNARGRIPANAGLRLIVPVAIGGLTPLALASKNKGLSGDDRLILLSSTAFSILYLIVVMAALRTVTTFLSLYHPILVRNHVLKFVRGRVALVIVGLLIICYAAAVNIAVSID